MTDSIAITGATGFIGGALLDHLVSAGRQVRALIRPGSTHKKPLDTAAVEWIQGDLDDGASLRQLARGATAVVHCAGAVRGATAEQFRRVNVDGVARLVQALSGLQEPPRFLLISSLTAREPQVSDYAASKHQGEQALKDSAGSMLWSVYRPCAVYGPGDREMLPVLRWMARGMAPLLGTGNGRFSLIYIADLVDAIMRWLAKPFGHQYTFELHDGKPHGYSWHEVIDTVSGLSGRPIVRLKIPIGVLKLTAAMNLALARVLGYAPMLTPGKVRELSHADWSASDATLRDASGWSPRIGLTEGLGRTLGLATFK